MTSQIRLATVEDAGQVQAIYAPIVRETAISFEVEPPSVAEMGRRIAETLVRWPWLVCARGDEVRGYAYAGAHRARPAYQWSVDVTIYVRVDGLRTGVGRALYTALFAILARQGFHGAYAGITLPNPASVGLHEALGFRPVGVYEGVGYKLGAWRDVGWWQLALGRRSDPPAPPNDLAVVQASPGWSEALAVGSRLLRA